MAQAKPEAQAGCTQVASRKIERGNPSLPREEAQSDSLARLDPSEVVQLVQLVRISRDVYWRSPWRGSRYDGMEHLQGIGQCKLLPVHQQAPPDDQPANSATHASGCASHVVGQLEPWRLDRGGDQLLWDQRCSGGVPLPERHVRCAWGYEHRPQRGSAHGHQGPPPR